MKERTVNEEIDLMLLCIFEQSAAVIDVLAGTNADTAKNELLDNELIQPIDKPDAYELTAKGRNYCLASYG